MHKTLNPLQTFKYETMVNENDDNQSVIVDNGDVENHNRPSSSCPSDEIDNGFISTARLQFDNDSGHSSPSNTLEGT